MEKIFYEMHCYILLSFAILSFATFNFSTNQFWKVFSELFALNKFVIYSIDKKSIVCRCHDWIQPQAHDIPTLFSGWKEPRSSKNDCKLVEKKAARP